MRATERSENKANRSDTVTQREYRRYGDTAQLILRNHEFVAFRTRPHGASAREWGIFEIRKSNYVVLTTSFGCGRGEMPKKYEYRRRRTFTRTNSASTRITANGAPPARRIRPNITENNRRNGTRIRRDRESGAFRPHRAAYPRENKVFSKSANRITLF